MKNLETITNGLSKLTGKFGLRVKAYSPEILLVLGISGGIVATVLACKATLKAHEVIEERNEKYETVQSVLEQIENGEIS